MWMSEDGEVSGGWEERWGSRGEWGPECVRERETETEKNQDRETEKKPCEG